MYAAHFGLTERPFSLAPDPRYLYLSDAHREALAHLLYAGAGGGQSRSAEVLEEIRLLTNLETTREKLLQVILIGQPELAELLARPELRQLAQRVTARYHLRPFTEEETRAYVQHRMEVAGQRQPVFEAGAVRVAHRLAHGVPRRLNTICDRALLGAYAAGLTRVTAPIVRRAALEVLGRLARSRRWVAAAAIAAVLVGVGSAVTLLGVSGLPRLGPLALRWGVANSAPATPMVPVVLAPAAVAARRTLTETLGDPSVNTDETTAFAKLYALWQLNADPNATDLGCEYGYQAGFRWLRQRLGEVEGDWTPARGDPVYDEELKRRVIAFQQVESLTPDGIVGEETLVRLAAARLGAGVPSLSRSRP